MAGLTASLLLTVPLLQLLSLAASIKSYVMFYQRAGSIWAFVVREAKVVPQDIPTAGVPRGPFEGCTPSPESRT